MQVVCDQPTQSTEDEPSKEVNEHRYLNELFEEFQKLPPGEQHYYLGQMKKLFEGRYQLISIEEPRVIQKNRGRPKGAPKKFKKIPLKSSRRNPSAFEKVVEKKVRRKVVKGKGKKKEKTPEDVSNFSIIFFTSN